MKIFSMLNFAAAANANGNDEESFACNHIQQPVICIDDLQYVNGFSSITMIIFIYLSSHSDLDGSENVPSIAMDLRPVINERCNKRSCDHKTHCAFELFDNCNVCVQCT